MLSIWKIFFIFAIFNSIFSNVDGDDEWCYEGKCGPRYWKGKCKFGETQSPINFVPSKTRKSKLGRKLKFSKDYYDVNDFEIKNNGHTVQLQMNPDETSNLLVEGAGFKGKYSFSQMHFHWGKNNNIGSEHMVKGRHFPLELHLVHEQINGAGGIGVIGIIYGISNKDNLALQPIIDALSLVTSVSEEPIQLDTGINLTALFPPVWDVFRYEGSLTTPPCTEQILWSVFTQRMPISKSQVASFRKILDAQDKPILRNWRTVKNFKTTGKNTIYWMPIDKNKMISQAF